MNLNNKGFMMAEVVVVTAVVLVTIGTLYTSYNKVYQTYKKRITYYDISTLNRLATYRDLLVFNNKDTNIVSLNDYIKDNTDKVVRIKDDNNLKKYIDMDYDTLYLVKTENNTNLNTNKFNSEKPTFKDYISYLNTSNTYSNYILILEHCYDKNIDNCTYAYLEVYEEK